MERRENIDLDKLEAAAKGATPGPWRWSEDRFESRCGDPAPSLLTENGHGILSCDGPDNGPKAADAHFIAAASPDVVLALVERVRRAEARADVRGGEWCAQNRAEGRGPCGACAWCCAQQRDWTERVEAASRAYIKARDTWGYTAGAVNEEARAAEALRSALSTASEVTRG